MEWMKLEYRPLLFVRNLCFAFEAPISVKLSAKDQRDVTIQRNGFENFCHGLFIE